VNLDKISYKNEPFIIQNQTLSVFYVNDPLSKMWSVNLQGRVPHDSDTNINSTLEIDSFLNAY